MRRILLNATWAHSTHTLALGVLEKMAKKTAAKYPTFFVKSAVKDFAKRNNMMVGSDAYEAINNSIGEMLTAAAKRCKDNKRKTLKAYDL